MPQNQKPTLNKQLESLILSVISVPKVRQLRQRYSESGDSIAELSQKTEVLPVLLWSLLTPARDRTGVKLRLLANEIKINEFLNQGKTLPQIARLTNLPLETVMENTVDLFALPSFFSRPWYDDRAFEPEEDYFYDAEDLPTTSRLGWKDDLLTDIPPERRGRCPECGHIVWMPCLYCRIKEDLRTGKIKASPMMDDSEEEAEEHNLTYI